MPNANSGLVNIGKLPECNNTQNSPSMHDIMLFRVVGAEGVPSVETGPSISYVFCLVGWNVCLMLPKLDLQHQQRQKNSTETHMPDNNL